MTLKLQKISHLFEVNTENPLLDDYRKSSGMQEIIEGFRIKWSRQKEIHIQLSPGDYRIKQSRK